MLYAKSKNKYTEGSFLGHIGNVTYAARKLARYFPEIEEKLIVASALFHDIGKCSKEFQLQLASFGDRKQTIYHEKYSALILHSVREYLTLTEDEIRIVACAVLGHHLRTPDDLNKPKPIPEPSSSVFRYEIHSNDADVPKLFKMGIKLGLINAIPTLPDSYQKKDIRETNVFLAKQSSDQKLSLLKAVTCLADLLGSIHFHKPFRKELTKILDNIGIFSKEDAQKMISDRLKGKDLNDLQKRLGTAGKKVLCIAGTGEGKTIGAINWASQWDKKLFFSFPTTNTATASYLDYAMALTEDERGLVHSRNAVDFEILGIGDTDNLSGYDALDILRHKYINCTCDRVLGIVNFHYKSLTNILSYRYGAFVFDEIHCYDAELFGSLIAFLRAFPDVPVLVMSASVLFWQKQIFLELGFEFIKGKSDRQSQPKYNVTYAKSADDFIANRLNQKILYICNEVGIAQREYKRLKQMFPETKIYCYHSRFPYYHRVQRQQEIIEAMAGNEPCIVVATQVCEMSLDISADAIVTQNCPLASLIQRFGRGKRHSLDRCDCCILPYFGLVYPEESLSKLVPKTYSYDDLVSLLPKLFQDYREFSCWHDQAWMSSPQSNRGEDFPSVSCCLSQHRHFPKKFSFSFSLAKAQQFCISKERGNWILDGLFFDEAIGIF